MFHGLKRRTLLASTAALLARPARVFAQTPAGAVRTYGLSLVGELALPEGFAHFPYVDPNAPKGGQVATAAVGSFDSFNPFIVRGTPAGGSAQIYDTLTVPSSDEPEASYAHLAAYIEIAADRRSVAFELRPEARFHDGKPVTAEDVVWTFETLRDKGRPLYRQYYADVDHVVAETPARVVFHFRTSENRELAQIIGELPILPKHWWEGRDFAAPLTDPPLGSGPYRIGRFELGRTLVLERVADYWAAALPTAIGLHNFGTIRTEYYRDATVALEAFKAGQVDYRLENSAKNWATAYDFPAVEKGLVKKRSFTRHLPTGMQGFGMNLRRKLFADRNVRAALVEMFDFEWMNKNLFYGTYTRTASYFSSSDYASSGLPEGDELALLAPYRDKLPPEVFTAPFSLPVTDGSGNNRDALRRALGLLKQAGWNIVDRKLVNAAGEAFSFEILLDQPAFERIALPYVQAMERLGMQVRVRTVDPSQYQQLMDKFDYDMTVVAFGQSDSPGNEQADFWGCKSAAMEGSMNLMGICDPVVDAMVAQVLAAKDHKQLITATRALDRVLLSGQYLVPQFHSELVNIAYWDRFGIPPQPVRVGVDVNSWWVDAARAAVTDAARNSAPK